MANAKTQIEVTVLDKASRALDKIKGKFAGLNNSKVGEAMARITRATSQSSKVLGAYAAAGGVVAAGAGVFAKGVMDTASEFERYETILGTLEGGSEKAKESMAWISDFAAKTPYEMNEVTDAFVKLKAYGMDPMKDGLLNSLGDTAAAMGKPVMQAVEAIADAVTGENERLKEFGIKASKIKGTNFTQYTYNDKDGKQRVAKVESDNRAMIQATLQTIWNEKYGGAMDKLSGTWEGMVSNLADQWSRFKLLIAQSGVFDFLKDKLQGFLEKINKMAADGSLQKLAETIGQKLVTGFERLWEVGGKIYDKFVAINDFFGGFENTLTALGVVALLPLVAAIANIGMAIGSLVVALAPLATALIPAIAGFAPFILAGIAIGLLAGYIWSNWEPISGWIMEKWAAVTDFLSGVWESIKSLFSAGFDLLKSYFLNFTPLGLMIQAMQPIIGWVVSNWESIKAVFSGAISAIGSILSSFNPVQFVQAAFARLQSFIGGIFDGIKAKAASILNLSQEAGRAASSLPAPGAVVRGGGGAGRVDVSINHSNVPRGTTMKTTASNRVNLSSKQGYAFG